MRATMWVRVSVIVAGSVAVSGCSTPALDAFVMGKPEELNQLLVTRHVDVNAYLPLESGSGYLTPLCAMLGSTQPVAVSSIDFLLENGADLNQPCGKGNGYDDEMPLDFAFDYAVNSQAKRVNPYHPERTGPSKFPIMSGIITKLLAHGAKSSRGLDTAEAMNAEMARWNAANDKQLNEWEEEIRRDEAESRNNSFFNAQTLGAVAAVAGSAATIYAGNNSATSTLSGAAMNTMASSTSGVGSAAVRENTANTSLQNMAGMDAATANARAERSQKLDDIVAQLASDGGMKVLKVSYQCSPSEPVQTVSVPYKSQACATAKQNWFTVYACNDVDQMSAATEQCRQACGDPRCDEGL